MQKIYFDGEILTKNVEGIGKATLFLIKAINEISPETKIINIQRRKSKYDLSKNIETKIIKFPYVREFWRETILPAYYGLRKDAPLYFPANGNIPSFIPSSKIAMTIHDILPLIVPNFFRSGKKENRFRKNVQKSLDRSRMVFTVSEYSKNELIKNFNLKSEPIIMPNAITLESYGNDTIFDLEKTEDYFVYTGRYDMRKGLIPLLKIFIDLHKEKKIKSKLYLTGNKIYFSEEFKGLVDQVTELGILKEFGYVTDEKLSEMMRKSKGLIYPSKYEGFGLPPLEAMNVGCPVITTNCTSIPEVCGDAVIYTDIDNFADFANAIISLENNAELRKQLIYKGFEQVKKFSWHKSAEIFLENMSKLN